MKKFFAVMLALCMVFSMSAIVMAADAPFTDVEKDVWYTEDVAYVYENKIMFGVGNDLFAPENAVTRAMVWTTLARLDGIDATDNDSWWLESQKWVVENKISDGLREDAKIERQELVAMMYRYADYKGVDVSIAADLSVFTDADEIATWDDAKDAMAWSCAAGLIEGVGNHTLAPTKTASRAELAAILHRFANVVNPEQPEQPEEPEQPEQPEHKHAYSDWSSNNNGIHSKKCSVEGCDEPIITEDCQLNDFVSNGDGTHCKKCSVCGYTSEKNDCNFGTLIGNGDGTHSKTCADCEYVVKEDCDNCYHISDVEDLLLFSKIVDGENTNEEPTLLNGKTVEDITFDGKIVYLDNDIDLYAVDENDEPVCFDPIGSYRFDKSFKGTFDGQYHTIFNLNQNTWALNNGYYYNDCGLGLFGAVENGTVKNIVIDGAGISGESALCGVVASVAQDAIFENITVKNSNCADYQYYAGGIVGWASGKMKFVSCNIEASTTVGSQWGDFNNANGGVIGGISDTAEIFMKDCTVACRIDAVNDVVSAYKWYSYRRSGMLIGDTEQIDDPDGNRVGDAIAPNLTCENVTVIYGDWANYTYCEFAGTGYPFVRVQAGTSVDAYSNVRYGHPTDANGNIVVDDNHVHNDGEKHHELIVFDQLYGGATGDRYCTYGTATHDGVTVKYPDSL